MDSVLDAIYYSGVVRFSNSFGDAVLVDGPLRLLTSLGASEVSATLGLVIGYLPPLYSAYQSRERQLLRLDDLSEDRITPVTLATSYLARGGLPTLELELDRWADWCADVFETHTSFPMLVYLWSWHPGHSWVTSLAWS